MNVSPVVKPVDEVPPPGRLLLFGLQHVLVMAASPITSVFLVSRALNLDAALSLGLLSATFLACGVGGRTVTSCCWAMPPTRWPR